MVKLNMEIKLLDKTYIDAIYSISSTVLMQDFPEYKPQVAKIYAQKYFNKAYFRKFLRSNKNCIIGAFEQERLIGIVVIRGDFGGFYL